MTDRGQAALRTQVERPEVMFSFLRSCLPLSALPLLAPHAHTSTPVGWMEWETDVPAWYSGLGAGRNECENKELRAEKG